METKYYYAENGKQLGPCSKEELREKNITPDTLVWRAGMDAWTPAGRTGELDDLFAAPTPPPMPSFEPPVAQVEDPRQEVVAKSEPVAPQTESVEKTKSSGLATVVKIFSIIGIVFAGIMHLFGWVMLIDSDRRWSYNYYYSYRGIDSEWGLLYMMVSVFFLVFCIISMATVNRRSKNS